MEEGDDGDDDGRGLSDYLSQVVQLLDSHVRIRRKLHSAGVRLISIVFKLGRMSHDSHERDVKAEHRYILQSN